MMTRSRWSWSECASGRRRAFGNHQVAGSPGESSGRFGNPIPRYPFGGQRKPPMAELARSIDPPCSRERRTRTPGVLGVHPARHRAVRAHPVLGAGLAFEPSAGMVGGQRHGGVVDHHAPGDGPGRSSRVGVLGLGVAGSLLLAATLEPRGSTGVEG